MELGPVVLREPHVGEHIRLGLIHEGGELGQLGPELVGDLAPLCLAGGGILLGEGGGDEGRDDTAAALAGMRQGIPHEVDPAALPGGVQHPGGGDLEPLMRVGDHQLDTAQAAAGETAQELGPEGLGLRWADVQAQHLTAAVGVGPDRHDHRDRDDPAGLADLDVGGVDPQIRPVALDRAGQKGLDLLVDLLAQPAHPRFRGGRLWLLETPEPPMARTSSSTERVEIPWT